MASRFVLYELDLYFATTLLLAGLGLVLVLVVVAGRVNCIMVRDERVVADVVRVDGVVGGGSTGMHVEGALAFAHGICGRRRTRL
jgi:hypothetical protein